MTEVKNKVTEKLKSRFNQDLLAQNKGDLKNKLDSLLKNPDPKRRGKEATELLMKNIKNYDYIIKYNNEAQKKHQKNLNIDFKAVLFNAVEQKDIDLKIIKKLLDNQKVNLEPNEINQLLNIKNEKIRKMVAEHPKTHKKMSPELSSRAEVVAPALVGDIGNKTKESKKNLEQNRQKPGFFQRIWNWITDTLGITDPKEREQQQHKQNMVNEVSKVVQQQAKDIGQGVKSSISTGQAQPPPPKTNKQPSRNR